MSQTWQTVLLSLATSLIVCLITFILGLKSGKNQADRAKLQNLYRDLYSHFSDLKESLQRDRPKSWASYKKVERGFSLIEYFPPVKELKRSGDILFLNQRIANEALDLEKQVLNYSSSLDKHISNLHAALISDLKVYREGYIFKNGQPNSSETAHFETANPKGCSSFRRNNYRVLYNKEELTKLFQQLQESDSTAVEFTTDNNPISYSAKFYPGGISVSTNEYVE